MIAKRVEFTSELEHVIVRNDKLAISIGGTTGHKISFPAVPLYHAATHAARDCNPVVRAALTGRSVNTRDTAEIADLDLSGIAGQAGDDHRAISFLAIPLTNSDDQVLGVLQLANAQDPATVRVIRTRTQRARLDEPASDGVEQR